MTASGFNSTTNNFVEDILPPETKANETSASILKQMRNGPIPRHRTDTALLTHFADRLEKVIQKEVQGTAVENAILPAVDISKTIPDKDIRIPRAMTQTVSAIEAILQSYAVIDQEPSLKANLESIIKNIEDALIDKNRESSLIPVPCPVCGKQPQVFWINGDECILECNHDYLFLYTGVYSSEEEAIEDWNRRIGKPKYNFDNFANLNMGSTVAGLAFEKEHPDCPPDAFWPTFVKWLFSKTKEKNNG